MRRRNFIALLGGAAAAWSSGSLAQKAPIRIGLLGSGAATSVITAAQTGGIPEPRRSSGPRPVLPSARAGGDGDRPSSTSRAVPIRIALQGVAGGGCLGRLPKGGMLCHSRQSKRCRRDTKAMATLSLPNTRFERTDGATRQVAFFWGKTDARQPRSLDRA
jgi:hypothetical protein